MVTSRAVRKVWKSQPTVEGAGVRLKRAFGYGQLPQLDPFLLLDDFHSAQPADYLKGFPWHPHRGIETITYVLEGAVEHGDSMGHTGIIASGDVQWMTAGSGIIHQEMPKGDERGLMWGFQLWANLPAARKMMAPRYRGIRESQIPRLELAGGAIVRIICGQLNGTQGPVRDVVIDPEYLDVSLPAQATFVHPTRRGHTVFAYVIDGRGYFDDCRGKLPHDTTGANYFDFDPDCAYGAETLVLFGDGDQVAIKGDTKPLRFLLVSGQPIGEPVAWYGPIVMNTLEELRLAFQEYEAGTFIKA